MSHILTDNIVPIELLRDTSLVTDSHFYAANTNSIGNTYPPPPPKYPPPPPPVVSLYLPTQPAPPLPKKTYISCQKFGVENGKSKRVAKMLRMLICEIPLTPFPGEPSQRSLSGTP